MARATVTVGNVRFSLKEYQVAELVTEGLKNAEVAEIVGTTEDMVKNYLRDIYDKSGQSTRLELALWMIRKQWEAAQDEKRMAKAAAV